jgi:NTP pyrophosphatase (non-canonical NTP hydrolase)
VVPPGSQTSKEITEAGTLSASLVKTLRLEQHKIRGEDARMPNTPSDATLRDLTNEVKAFCSERDWDQFHTAKEVAIGMVTESAELLDLFRFKTEQQCEEILNDPARREKVSDELADVFFFVLRFAERTGIDLKTALSAKMQKNHAKYPVEKARGNNKKYNEF